MVLQCSIPLNFSQAFEGFLRIIRVITSTMWHLSFCQLLPLSDGELSSRAIKD